MRKEPCKKCVRPVERLMAAASPFFTCANDACVNHIPCIKQEKK